jgi:hypothetical protein
MLTVVKLVFWANIGHTRATLEETSLCMYVTISDAQKLSTFHKSGDSPECSIHGISATSTSTRTMSAQFYALCSKYGQISHVAWNIPFLYKALLLSDVSLQKYLHIRPVVLLEEVTSAWRHFQAMWEDFIPT